MSKFITEKKEMKNNNKYGTVQYFCITKEKTAEFLM